MCMIPYFLFREWFATHWYFMPCHARRRCCGQTLIRIFRPAKLGTHQGYRRVILVELCRPVAQEELSCVFVGCVCVCYCHSVVIAANASRWSVIDFWKGQMFFEFFDVMDYFTVFKKVFSFTSIPYDSKFFSKHLINKMIPRLRTPATVKERYSGTEDLLLSSSSRSRFRRIDQKFVVAACSQARRDDTRNEKIMTMRHRAPELKRRRRWWW